MATKRSARKQATRVNKTAIGMRYGAETARKQKREAIVRMYRQGLGDCFLITLPREPEPFRMLLDCGALKSRHYGEQEMENVVNDIIRVTTRRKGEQARLDVVAVTHEHWDHISGFSQVQKLFDKIKIENVWVAWTEEPNNPVAQHLKTQFKKKKKAVEKALALMPENQKNDMRIGLYRKAISDLFGFFGELEGGQEKKARSSKTTEAAWDYILSRGTNTYCDPRRSPLEIKDVEGVRVYILGPPQDPNFVRRKLSTTETYAQATRSLSLYDSFLAAVAGDDAVFADESLLDARERAFPFGASFRVPPEHARNQPFFKSYYGFEDDQSEWRRIDTEWLTMAGELALHLDSYTNNTCLAFAIELGESGKVLLFPGDAQVGSWLSWGELKWDLTTQNGESRTVKIDDLLARTVLYKVGHHGSHNATLRAKGLEKMESPELVAMIPVHRETAKDQAWEFPHPQLWEHLKQKACGRVLLADSEGIDEIANDVKGRLSPIEWKKFEKAVKFTPLYVEYRIAF